jgi:hypothetical protein
MIIEAPRKPAQEATDIASTFFKLRSEEKERSVKAQVSSGCAICSAYEALARRGWLKNHKTESDYKNHLLARHGLEV